MAVSNSPGGGAEVVTCWLIDERREGTSAFGLRNTSDRERHRDDGDRLSLGNVGRNRRGTVGDDGDRHGPGAAGSRTRTNEATTSTSTPELNNTTRAGSSSPTSGQWTSVRRSPARPAAIAATPSPSRITTWNAAKASTRSIAVEIRLDGSHPGRERERRCCAEGHRAGEREPHRSDKAEHRHDRADRRDPEAGVRRGDRARAATGAHPIPTAAPTPKSAISTPNSVSEASSTSCTNTMPIENSAPNPRATAARGGHDGAHQRNAECRTKPGRRFGRRSPRGRGRAS